MESKTEKIARLESLLVQTQDTLTRERKAKQEALEELARVGEQYHLTQCLNSLKEQVKKMEADLQRTRFGPTSRAVYDPAKPGFLTYYPRP